MNFRMEASVVVGSARCADRTPQRGVHNKMIVKRKEVFDALHWNS
jgi:hypothetical protein